MTRISHFQQQPKNIEFWDYYILCRLKYDAALVLQRLEYWDSTKDAGNVHAENINEALAADGKEPTQDTSRWIYKSQEELHWELMGAVGERVLASTLKFLIDKTGYLLRRHNPVMGFDRKIQYQVQVTLLRDHVSYLGYIISYFDHAKCRLNPVFYAIEQLTKEGVYIDTLSVTHVSEKITQMREDEKLPTFMKQELLKDQGVVNLDKAPPFRSFAEWKAQFCGMESAEPRNAPRKTAASITAKVQDANRKTAVAIPITTTVTTTPTTSTDSHSLTEGTEDEQTFRERETVDEEDIREAPTEPDLRVVKPQYLTLVPQPEPPSPPEPEPPPPPKPAPESSPFKCDPEHVMRQFNAWRDKADCPPGTFLANPLKCRPTGKKREQQRETCEELATLGSFKQICLIRQEMYEHDPIFWSLPENRCAIDEFTVLSNWHKFVGHYKHRTGRSSNGNGHAPGSVSGAPHYSGKVGT